MTRDDFTEVFTKDETVYHAVSVYGEEETEWIHYSNEYDREELVSGDADIPDTQITELLVGADQTEFDPKALDDEDYLE